MLNSTHKEVISEHIVGYTFQKRLSAIRERKHLHTRIKQSKGPADRDDWGQIPLTTEEFHFTPETDHPKGYVLGPRDCGKNFRLFLEACPVYIDPMSSLLGGYYVTFNQYLTQWDPEKYWNHLVFDHNKYGIIHGIDNFQHFLPDINIGLELGFGGLLSKIEHYRGVNRDEENQAFYDGLTEFVHAIQTWILKHVQAAEDMAEKEHDPELKENLLSIAQFNRKIINDPPEHFIDVLQWLSWYQMAKRCYIGGGSIGRIDQALCPYYQRDIKEGILTDEAAIFHIACFFIKDSSYVEVGGVDKKGRDLTNPVSFLVLEAAHRIKIPANIAVVVHEGMDNNLMRKSVELLLLDKLGTPRFVGLKGKIEGEIRNGFTLEEARSRVQAGCHWFCLPGSEYCFADVIKVNFAKVFEIAFYEMMCESGKEPNLDLLWDLFSIHLQRAIEVVAKGIDYYIEYHHQFYPELAISLLCHGPIEKGVDASHGSLKYTNICVDGAGLATVSDSFAAIEQRIVKENKITWNQLLGSLQKNWKNNAKVRYILQSVPGYGRGNTIGDKWADRLTKTFTKLVIEKPTPDGHRMVPGLFSWVSNIEMGRITGATPDGRLSGEPLSFGANPNSGRLRGGSLVPTTMSTAIARVQPGYGNTAPFQFDVDPGLVSDEDALEKFEAILRGHCELGGTLINANILDKNAILDAYTNPSKYPDLIVRVTGFSAYFASLSPELRKVIYDRVVSRE